MTLKSTLALFRPEIRELTPYSSARTEAAGVAGEYWFDANELPYTPYPADEETSGMNRYPEPQPIELRKILSDIASVNEEQVLLTRGADEAIDLIVRGFCAEGKSAIIQCSPTFGMYALSAKVQGADVIDVPLSKDKFDLDVEAILNAWNPSVKVVFLCSPNNPTSNLMDMGKIERLCNELDGKAIVVVDELYTAFSTAPSMTTKIAEYSNLIILQSISKAYGMAGLRIGMAIARPEIVRILSGMLPPYPLALPSIKIAEKALSPEGRKYLNEKIAIILQERERLADALQKSPEVEKVFSSDSNFLLVKVKDAVQLTKTLADQGIVIRNRNGQLHLENCVRISVGTPEENNKLIEALA